MITVTPAELPEHILNTWRSLAPDGRPMVPMIHGKPGIGKSAIVRQVAGMWAGGVPVWQRRLAQLDPATAFAFMMPDVAAGRMRVLLPEDWPAEPCVAFLDELNRAAVLTQNAGFEFIDHYGVFGHGLPDGSRIVAAVNYMSDGGGVVRIPSALGNRFRHFHLVVDTDAWCKWAAGAGVEPMVIAYQRWRQGNGDLNALHEFDAQADAWPSPRMWESVSHSVKLGLTGRALLVAVAGDVGEARALEFCAFVGLWAKLPSIDAILTNPTTEPVPTDMAQQYAVASALAARMSDQTFGRAVTYLERMSGEYLTFAIHDATARPAGHGEACGCGPCMKVAGIVHSGDYVRAMSAHSELFGG